MGLSDIGNTKHTFVAAMGVWITLFVLGLFNTDGIMMSVNAFVPVTTSWTTQMKNKQQLPSFGLSMVEGGEEDTTFRGVVELSDDDDEEDDVAPSSSPAAPFLSQGELAEDVLNPDLSDPKQTRVIIYIIISLIPVLFLVPLMLGSRDLIPLDALPPVELN